MTRAPEETSISRETSLSPLVILARKQTLHWVRPLACSPLLSMKILSFRKPHVYRTELNFLRKLVKYYEMRFPAGESHFLTSHVYQRGRKVVDFSRFFCVRDISGLRCTKMGSTNIHPNWEGWWLPAPEAFAPCCYPSPFLCLETWMHRCEVQQPSYSPEDESPLLKMAEQEGKAVWNLVTSWKTCTGPRLLTPRIFHCSRNVDVSLLKTCWSGFLLLAAKHVLNNTRSFLFASPGPRSILLNCSEPQEAGLSELFQQACLPSLVSGWTWPKHSTPMSLQCYIFAKIQQEAFTRMVTAVSFIKAKSWKQPKCPSIKRQTK